MTITKNPDRQDILVSRTEITFGTGNDIEVQGTYEAAVVPDGAIVVGGYVICTAATTAGVTVDVGDTDGDGDDDRYTSAPVSVAAVGTEVTPLVLTGYKYVTKNTIDLVVAGADPADEGAMELVVEYIIEGRSAFPQK